MRKRNYIFLFGSAILGLTMSAMPISADDVTAQHLLVKPVPFR